MDPISSETLAKLRAIQVAKKLPFIQTKVVGVMFAGRQEWVSKLWTNVTLLLHEPENTYDSNAVGVYGFVSVGVGDITVRKLGFLKKDIAKVVAMLRSNDKAPEEQKYNLARVDSMGGAESRKGVSITLDFSPEIRAMFDGSSDALKEVLNLVKRAKEDDAVVEARLVEAKS